MSSTDARETPALRRILGELRESLGGRLRSVVLYGSAARGDFVKATSDYNLILVLERLDLPTLQALAPALRGWIRRGQPMPRLFSPEVIREAADVFPIEFLDIRSNRVVLHGDDPFEGVEIDRNHLRLQCERELREKMMRLREGFIEAHGTPRSIRRLLTGSYGTFVALFRGCLRLLGGSVPVRNDEVVAAFCARAGLDPSPFEAIARLKQGDKTGTDPAHLFSGYYDALTAAVRRVDRFASHQGGNAS